MRLCATSLSVVLCTGILPLSSRAAEPRDLAPRDGLLDQTLSVVWEQVLPEDCLLGQITDVARGADGALYLVDYKFADVKVFDERGRFRRRLSRQGEGPGETTKPTDLVWRDDGRLGVMQRWPARLVWIDVGTGDPAGAVHLTDQEGRPLALPAVLGAVSTRRGLVVALTLNEHDGTRLGATEQLVRLDAAGRVAVVYQSSQEWWTPSESDHHDECDEYRPLERRWTAAPDGRLFAAPERDRFLVVAHAADGATLWTCERAYTAPLRSELELERAEKALRVHGWRTDNATVCQRPPVVAAMHWGDRDEIWVELDRGGSGPAGTIAWFDVLAADGTYVRQVRWHGDFDPEIDRRHRLDDRSVLVLRTDEDGTQTLRLLAAPPAAN